MMLCFIVPFFITEIIFCMLCLFLLGFGPEHKVLKSSSSVESSGACEDDQLAFTLPLASRIGIVLFYNAAHPVYIILSEHCLFDYIISCCVISAKLSRAKGRKFLGIYSFIKNVYWLLRVFWLGDRQINEKCQRRVPKLNTSVWKWCLLCNIYN